MPAVTGIPQVKSSLFTTISGVYRDDSLAISVELVAGVASVFFSTLLLHEAKNNKDAERRERNFIAFLVEVSVI